MKKTVKFKVSAVTKDDNGTYVTMVADGASASLTVSRDSDEDKALPVDTEVDVTFEVVEAQQENTVASENTEAAVETESEEAATEGE